jgi:hypothetical protein
MSGRPLVDREISAWIESEAPDRAPDRLRQAIRSEVAQEPQERGSAVFPRAVFAREHRFAAQAVGAAGVAVILLVIGIVAGTFLGGGQRVIEPAPSASPPRSSPSPSVQASAAPSPVPTPVGAVLAPGAFVTVAFAPHLRLTVPDGWVKTDDRPLGMRISPPGAGWLRQGNGGLPAVIFDGIGAYSRPVAGPPDGGTLPVTGVGASAKDLADWLSTRPQLTSTKPTKVTLAGTTAYELDFTLSPAAGGLCGIPCVNLLNSADGSASYQFGIEGDWKVRAFLLEAPDGTTMMITLDDVDGNGFDQELRAAQPVLDSIQFVP